MDDPAFLPSATEETEAVTEAEQETYITTQTILLHAANHNLEALKPFLRVPGAASVQDSETGFTPLHAAIASCGADAESEGNADATAPNVADSQEIEKAKAVVKELFLSGAIWNDLDANGETPGCLAWRLGLMELYELCVEAGVRAEVLLNLMGGIGGYEELSSGSEEEEEEEVLDGDVVVVGGEGGGGDGRNGNENGDLDGKEGMEKRDVNSEDYLKGELKFEDDKLLDADANGVMMAWETDIMRRSVDLLLPDLKPGARVLNIGFGMGIIDSMFASTSPSAHHIIEAHPSVLSHLSSNSPSNKFGPTWQSQPGHVLHAGKWQEICPKLLESGEIFDAIYFDTFGEDYSQLKLFFTEFIPGLLDEGGKFGFFNGLGADRRVCYDVYTRVVEMDLLDAGLEVEWSEVEVGKLGEEGEGEWSGVRRRYWVLDRYRLPLCQFLG